MHSGNYGNWVPNPAQRLASLLATMKDEDGRVLVAGFNDGIPPLTAEEQAMIAAVPDDSAEMLKTFGIAAPSKTFPRLQEALQYPTLNVRALQSAHVGAGARTITSGPRDRGDRHQARQGNEPRESRRQAARPRPRAGLPPRRRRAFRCRPRRALEAGRDCDLRVGDEGLPHFTE